MIYLKINGIILTKIKRKEKDAIVYILTKNIGLLKCYLKGIFQPTSKNITLFEPGNYNKLFIITDTSKFKIISALPLKILTSTFKKYPYIFLWTFRIIKNINLPETPKFLWFVLTHLDNYIKQNHKNFPYWFLYHLLRELGYEIDLYHCFQCQRKIKNFAYFDNKSYLFCSYCKKDSFLKINKEDLQNAREIKSLIKIPKKVPNFLKTILVYNYNTYF
jgi:DNA repair protein RecO